MSSPSRGYEELPADKTLAGNGEGVSSTESLQTEAPRPPAKRHLSATVIEISDTESDDSDVCAVNSYQASADEVKRIRGADYSSSSSSSSDYSSDSESPWEDDSILIEDDIVHSKIVKATLNPRANRMDDPKLNPKLQSQELIDRLTTHWKEKKDFTSKEVTLTCDPFRLCLLHGLLDNPEIINNIVDDMNTLDWSRKKMDLYEFHQTTDLASLTWQRSIRGIYELLKNELMPWVSRTCGVPLTSVSASCSLYGPGDHLLPHDDLLGDRRVAFILYLSPWRTAPRGREGRDLHNGGSATKETGGAVEVEMEVEGEGERQGWSPSMGGALELFARDEAGPTRVVRSIFPRNNTLAFFRVGVDSYHQVSEVLSLELPRLSINGWFHGPAAEGDGPEPEPEPELAPEPLPELLRPHSDVVVLSEWVDPAYMSPRARASIQTCMERGSEACLRGLLAGTQYAAVMEALRRADTRWESVGPAHRRRYSRLDGAWLAALPAEHPLAGLMRLVRSAPYFRLLADCTDLAPVVCTPPDLQRWTVADYTVLPPRETYQQARLEAVLYLGGGGDEDGDGARPPAGGGTVFVAPEETEGALVTLPPLPNALGLVYCDAGTASFTKYVSRLSRGADPAAAFYVLACSYREA